MISAGVITEVIAIPEDLFSEIGEIVSDISSPMTAS
jgi:hypothetical protein